LEALEVTHNIDIIVPTWIHHVFVSSLTDYYTIVGVAYSSIYQLSILIFLLLIVILTPPLYLIKKSIGSLQILSILIDVVRSAPNGIVCAEALMLSLLGPWIRDGHGLLLKKSFNSIE
jgi:hypothetical protein